VRSQAAEDEADAVENQVLEALHYLQKHVMLWRDADGAPDWLNGVVQESAGLELVVAGIQKVNNNYDMIIVDASAYFLSRGWLRTETKPTPPHAICAMRSPALLTLNVRGSYDNTYSQIILTSP
jgi:hypothetical protein